MKKTLDIAGKVITAVILAFAVCVTLFTVISVSTVGKENASSIISAMEGKAGYPPVVRLGTNGLKISKTDFKNKLQESIDTGKIVA